MKRALVLAAAVAVLLAAEVGPAEADPRIAVATQNVRYTLGPVHARHDVRDAAARSSIVFAQEFGLRRASRFAPTGWGTVHYPGLRRGDCATFYDRATWRRVRSWPIQLTRAPFRAGTRWAVVTILRDHAGRTLATINVHLITRARHRRAVYRHGIARLDRVASQLAQRSPVVIGGDWNLPHAWDLRTRLRGFPARTFLPEWRTAATPRLTTRRARLDYFYATRDLRVVRISRIGNTYSDHDGARVVLRLSP